MTDKPAFSPVAASRRLVREARAAALATLTSGTGAPFVSLVTVATDTDGSPVLLLSDLAAHTRNLKSDPRASLLFDERAPGAAASGDPLTGARVTLAGRLERLAEDAVPRRRFLAKQPDAAGYATFRDFAFYRLVVEVGHLVAGFGRINDLKASDLLLDLSDAGEIVEGEAGIVEHLNEDHADTLRLYATRLLGAPDAAWRATGCDPEGLDLAAATPAGDMTRRLVFPAPVRHSGPLRATLKHLADMARGSEGN
ncbi:HugZ family pyridoxamine 5'-phosphate oxidase [Prosthecomicrobium sp. N25]|uniref:HugZ family pyridoxamine 5'-phosphate oxidase n=1 Tax=Prosthecomicrobium sp. N25 TaxID=3129254 RepID=UPI00307826C1